MLFNLIVDIFVRLIFPLSIYICPSDLHKIEQHDSTKTKWEDQMDKYIYYKIEQHDSTKAKGEDQTDKYIY
jgi:hypothetical protein